MQGSSSRTLNLLPTNGSTNVGSPSNRANGIAARKPPGLTVFYFKRHIVSMYDEDPEVMNTSALSIASACSRSNGFPLDERDDPGVPRPDNVTSDGGSGAMPLR